jgi:Predicted GTPase
MQKVFVLQIFLVSLKALPKEKAWGTGSCAISNAILFYFFLIPADSKDHKQEFEILLNELEQYNPEMLQKDFVIAISKADMLDEELKMAIEKELPKNIPHVFISSVTGQGLMELKDLLWNTLNTAKV